MGFLDFSYETLSFSEAKVAQPGTICLISDDSDFRSRGEGNQGDKAARKSGEGGNLPGDKKVVLLWKKLYQHRPTTERNTLIGRLVG